MEGILYADHRGPTHGYYLHVPFAETMARHDTNPQAVEYGEAEMRGWFRELDLLPSGSEAVIGAEYSLTETVDRIIYDTGLAGLPALEYQQHETSGTRYVEGSRPRR